MRTRQFIGLGLVLLLAVVGCSRKIAPSTATEVHDSVRTEIVYRDVPVQVPGETVTVRDTIIRCDKATNKPIPMEIKQRKGAAFVDLKIKADGSISGTGGCDSLAAVIKAKDQLITKLRTEKTIITNTVIQYERHWYDIAARWIAGIFILIVAGIVLVKFNKIKLP